MIDKVLLEQLMAVKDGDPSPANSMITPTSATISKRKPADITVTMALNGNTLLGIKNGTSSLVQGTDYTVSGNTVTVSKTYLGNRPLGSTSLTFDFSAGIDPVLTVTIKR
jgi:mannan endo-1,4-beta-mannosidase